MKLRVTVTGEHELESVVFESANDRDRQALMRLLAREAYIQRPKPIIVKVEALDE